MGNNANIYTELMAICKLKECLLQTKQIIPIINEVDKEPVWDGSLYVYEKEGIVDNKKSLIDMIPIQVKGTCTGNIKNSKISYPIRTDDLKKFKSNGGALYFVVVLSKSGKKFSVFYKTLLPFDIVSIMSGKENQSTISVTMNNLDIDNKVKMISIFKSFITNRKKQSGTAEQGFKLREQLSNGKTSRELNIKEFTFSINSEALNDMSNMIPTYIYAKDNNGVELPINSVLFEKISTNSELEVKIGNDIYMCNIEFVQSVKEETLILENSIYLYKHNKNLKFKFSNDLEERIKVLHMMKSLYQSNIISIQNVLEAKIGDYNLIPISTLKDTINYYEKIKKALQIIKAPLNLSFENFSEADSYKIQLLISSLIDNKPFKNDIVYEGPLSTITIGNLNLLVYTAKKETGEFIIEPVNFTDLDTKIVFNDSSNIEYPISACVLLKKHEWAIIDNLSYDDIYNSIVKRGFHIETIDILNNTVLEIIAGFDECNNLELLDLAINILDWINSNNKQDFSIINYYQCIKRKRPFTDSEKNDLVDMKYNSENDIFKFGIAVLLDDKNEANYFWNRLSTDEQEANKEFPIFTLYMKM